MHTAVNILAGKGNKVRPRKTFDAMVMNFLTELSNTITQNSLSRKYVDLAAFAFWIRKNRLSQWKEKYNRPHALGRGMAFHIAPANVPLNFAYSFVFGLLSGNSNIVRVSGKDFAQVDILCDILRQVFKNYPEIEEENAIVRYPHHDEINAEFSSTCQVRVIWGGDETIRKICSFPVAPATTEVHFANRVSMALVGSDRYIRFSSEEKQRLAHLFYNDTYFSDQMACSSPAMIFFLGEQNEAAKEEFFTYLAEESKKYPMDGVRMVEKYALMLETMARGGTKRIFAEENLIVLNVDKPYLLTELLGRFGLFYQYDIQSVEDLLPWICQSVQTLSYTGISAEELYQCIEKNHLLGIDRIVPFGEGLSMDLLWDGYPLISAMSREISVLG